MENGKADFPVVVEVRVKAHLGIIRGHEFHPRWLEGIVIAEADEKVEETPLVGSSLGSYDQDVEFRHVRLAEQDEDAIRGML